MFSSTSCRHFLTLIFLLLLISSSSLLLHLLPPFLLTFSSSSNSLLLSLLSHPLTPLCTTPPLPPLTSWAGSSQFGAELWKFPDQYAEAELQRSEHQRASGNQTAGVPSLAELWQRLLLRRTVIHCGTIKFGGLCCFQIEDFSGKRTMGGPCEVKILNIYYIGPDGHPYCPTECVYPQHCGVSP